MSYTGISSLHGKMDYWYFQGLSATPLAFNLTWIQPRLFAVSLYLSTDTFPALLSDYPSTASSDLVLTYLTRIALGS